MKSEYIQIRVSEHEKKTIKTAAYEAGLDMSAYILGHLDIDLTSQWESLLANLQGSKSEDLHYPWAAIIDFLTPLNANQFQHLFQSAHKWALSPENLNYLAATVERKALNLGISAPKWLLDIPPCANPYFADETPKLKLYLLLHGDPVFRRRNIFIDSSIGGRI